MCIETLKILVECNHEKANTRKIFHALQQKTKKILCSKDTDIPVWTVFVYALNKITDKSDILEPTIQQSISKFMQLKGVIQLLFFY